MRIAIIGTGNVGSAIARGLAGKGHAITLGARTPEAEEVAVLADATGATRARPAAAAATAEVVVLALPWWATEAAVKGLGDLTGKVVIDCTNPLAMVGGVLSLAVGHDTSGAELVQGWAPGARVVKTLNQVGAEIMAKNDHLASRPVQFVAGDDADAKAIALRLLADLGFEGLDAGDLTRARLLEPFAMVWINQAILRGAGRDWAFAVTR